MNYDLSSDVMGDHQHGASFYGSLFNLCTCVRFSKCGRYATLHCPEENSWNVTCGKTIVERKNEKKEEKEEK